MFTHIPIDSSVYIYADKCKHIFMYIYLYVICILIYTHTPTHIKRGGAGILEGGAESKIYAYMYTYVYTYTHTYIYVCK